MDELRGMLSVEDLAGRVSRDEIDTVLVVFSDLYGRLVGKRYDAHFFVDHAERAGTHACDYLFTVDMGMNPVPGYAFANWEAGYGDVHLLPDLATLRHCTWLEHTAMVQCDVWPREGGGRLELAPRSVLRRAVEATSKLGYAPVAASELEFYLFRTSYRDAAASAHHGLDPAGWYIEDYHTLQGTRVEDYVGPLRRHLSNSGVPVETSKGEWGLGQHELNVRYTDALGMADRHSVYKQCAKELADARGVSVTFMAKPFEDQAGSSCHIHLSLWDGDKNAFAGTGDCGGVPSSDVFRWFLGGWIAHAHEVMPCYAPTVNSYKRYQAGSWAPTKLAWSYDNRTAGFRVVGADSSLRIECRIPGADVNPYIAFAAALHSGLDGIRERIEPPARFEGDMYAATELPGVPTSLREATDTFASSAFARAAFGDDVVEHYAHFWRTEQAAYDKSVTDWERNRYFEQI